MDVGLRKEFYDKFLLSLDLKYLAPVISKAGDIEGIYIDSYFSIFNIMTTASIHFNPVKPSSEIHDQRKKEEEKELIISVKI